MHSQNAIRLTSASMRSARNRVLAVSAMAACVTFFVSGCARHRMVVLPPLTEAPQPVQPVVIPPVETAKPAPTTPPATQTQPPATQTAQPQTPPTATAPPADAPPKVDAPKKPTAESPRPPAPQISPQLSPRDEAELRRQTSQFIGDAEKNLHRADGRDLNATQRDMIEKIRGFLDQVHDAIKTSDWTRARNLSQKAYLVSVELANTLS